MVEAQQHIRAIAYGVAAGGILLAIVFSLWIAARVSRPIEQLARAAEEVAGRQLGRARAGARARRSERAGAQLQSHDRATRQPARAAGAERARGRVARAGATAGARAQEPALPAATHGRESGPGARRCQRRSSTKSSARARRPWATEIANLKTIIGRFSDFSKMPKPELERIDAQGCDRARARALRRRGGQNATRRFASRSDVADGSRCRSTPIRSCCIARSRISC